MFLLVLGAFVMAGAVFIDGALRSETTPWLISGGVICLHGLALIGIGRNGKADADRI